MFMENGREKLDMLKLISMAWWQPEPVLQIVAKSKQSRQSSEKNDSRNIVCLKLYMK